MTRSRHAWIALLLLISVLLSLYIIVLEPILAEFRDRHEAARSLEERTARYLRIAAMRTAIEAEVDELERATVGYESQFYEQPTEALALAELQRKVKIFASSRGARLLTTQAHEAARSVDANRIALTVHLESELPALYAFLHDLDETVPPIRVDTLLIIGGSEASRAGKVPGGSHTDAAARKLDVTMTLVAYRRSIVAGGPS